MIGGFDNIKIQGMAAATPSLVENNMNYASVLGERRVKKQIRLTGVSKRHVASPYQRTSDLCYRAAADLIEHLAWNKEDIKLLIMVTQTGNYGLPSTAFFMQKRLGLSKDCFVFDINLGCSAFNAGMQVVSALMQSCKLHDKAILLIGDTSGVVPGPDNKLNQDNIADNMLFGSAGAAIAIEKVENHALYFMNKSDGDGFDAIIGYKNRPTVMNGTAVFDFAINDVTVDVKNFKKYFQLEEADIDYYVFHQAQKLILDNICADCEIPEEKELRSLEEYGNTSGTSVPVSVCANVDRFSGKDKVKLYLCGFGVGLSWGSIYTEIDTKHILPIIETDEHYDADKNPDNGLGDKTILLIGAGKSMGENIARMLDRFSARQILCDTDIENLKNIAKDFCIASEHFEVEALEKLKCEDIVSWCKVNNKVLDGLVILDERMGDGNNYSDMEKEELNEVLSDTASIVILSNNTNSTEEALEKIVNSWNELFFEQDIRVNAVCYDETNMDMVQVDPVGNEWIERYLLSNCSKMMKKPIEIANVVKQLLEDDGLYISGNVIHTKG